MSKGVDHVDEDEFVDMYHAFPHHNRERNQALFVFQAMTGFRIDEVLSLDIRDVWVNGKLAHRVEVSKRFMKKQRESSAIVLNETCREHLGKWLLKVKKAGNLKPNNPLFHYVKPVEKKYPRHPGIKDSKAEVLRLTPRAALKLYKEAADRANIRKRIGTHSVRKLFVDGLYEQSGRDPAVGQRAARHKTLDTLHHYIRRPEERFERAVHQFGEKFGRLLKSP